jgi:hypothetical protein
MNKFYKFVVIAIANLLILTVSSFSQVTEQKDKVGLLKTQKIKNSCRMMQDFFLDSLVLANKPGGLIMTKDSCAEATTLSESKSNDLSLNEKLNLITQINPNYSWKDEEGVINLVPSEYKPELLNVQISSFKTTDGYNLNQLIGELLSLPEVIKALEKSNLRRGVQFGGLTSPPSKKPKYDLILRDKTLQQLLNEIVVKRGRGVWVYSESNYNGVDTFTLDFLVR